MLKSEPAIICAHRQKRHGRSGSKTSPTISKRLSPIKGYAEILQETDGGDRKRRRHYAEVMLKNVSYMEKLIEDMKLTYQLENGMLLYAERIRISSVS